MLMCFAASWPVAIYRTWRAKRTEGKSLGFLVLVIVGYLSGITAKFVRAYQEGKPLELVTILYALCAILVATDLMLVLKYRKAAANAGEG